MYVRAGPLRLAQLIGRLCNAAIVLVSARKLLENLRFVPPPEKKMAPRLIFGTATLSMDSTEFQDKQSVNSLPQALRDAGISRLDTGARYPPLALI
jgi:hypothetical protein